MHASNDQVRAIVAAQFKGIYNRFSGGGAPAGRAFYWVSSALWYLGVLFIAWTAATTLPEIRSRSTLSTVLGTGLLLATIFWQLVPVLLATTGVSLDLRRLLVYPIASSRLFLIEVLLRASTGSEVLIVLAGAAVGLARNSLVPWYAPLFLLPFVAFNLLLSAGIRDLITRLLARRGVREIVVLVIVTLSVLPQLLIALFPPERWKSLYEQRTRIPAFPWPWQSAADLASGNFTLLALLSTAVWLAVAAWFGYSQFLRGLRWDAEAQRSRERSTASPRLSSLAELFFRLPARFLPDPLAALVEKEFRALSRAPRFRLVFFMGFTFGLIIWIPLAIGRNRGGALADNILVMVSLYAALLLGEVLFWNNLGFDRSAAQAYYVMPVRFSTVLIAKNITALFFLLLEIAIVTLVVLALSVPLPFAKIPEAFAVTLLLGLLLLTVGNLVSTHYPRPVDPAQSWRQSSSGKVQGILFLLYPVLALPIAIAYLARYAFSSEAAFYLVLAAAFFVSGLAYWVSLDSSVQAAENRREDVLSALSRGEGPIA